MKRRSFFASLAALFAAPFVAKPAIQRTEEMSGGGTADLSWMTPPCKPGTKITLVYMPSRKKWVRVVG